MITWLSVRVSTLREMCFGFSQQSYRELINDLSIQFFFLLVRKTTRHDTSKLKRLMIKTLTIKLWLHTTPQIQMKHINNLITNPESSG